MFTDFRSLPARSLVRLGVGVSLVLALMVSLVPTVSAEQVELRLNLEPGQEFKQRMEMEQVTDVQAAGQQMLEELIVTFDTTTEVLKSLEGDGVRVKVTNDRIVAEFDGQAGRGTYDSDKDGMPQIPNLMPFAAMAGKSFSYDLSPDGKVTNLEGFETMADDLAASMPLPEQAKAMVVNLLKKQLNNETMAQMIESQHGAYPPGVVGIGDDWKQEVHVSGIVPIDMSVDYKLTDTTVSTATAAMTGEVSTPDDAAMEVMPGVALQLDLDGTIEGLITYDRATGWVKSMESQQTIQGSMVTPDMGQGQPMTIPMAVDTTIRLEELPE